MIRLKLGERTLEYDEKRPLSAGDLVAIREMGADPERWVGMVERLGVNASERLRTAQYMELAEALIQVGYLAAVRVDHDVRWREFIWSLPIADADKWGIEVVTDEPKAVPTAKSKAKSAKPSVSATARRT